jgi:hypothetical protein
MPAQCVVRKEMTQKPIVHLTFLFGGGSLTFLSITTFGSYEVFFRSNFGLNNT